MIDRDYSLPGSYRKIVVKPGDVSWEILYYDDVQLPLIQGDVDILNNKPLTYSPQGTMVSAFVCIFIVPG